MSKVSVQAAEDLAASERRRSDRAELIVRVDYSTVDELFSEFTRDINEGGLFIETETPRSTGTIVSMQFMLPGSDEPICTAGRVVRTSLGGDGGPPGMGVEFDELCAEDSDRIDELIRGLRTGSGAR